MPTPEKLIAEAKTLLARAENGLKTIESAEPTQLRLAVHRLHLFLEQHGITEDAEPVEPAKDPEVAEKPKAKPKAS
jgi:hypothetical protein